MNLVEEIFTKKDCMLFNFAIFKIFPKKLNENECRCVKDSLYRKILRENK